MDPEQLLGSIIRGTLGGRRKRSRKTLRYLTGGKGSLVSAGTLLTAAGVAWGLYETMTSAESGSSAGPAGGSQPGSPPRGAGAPTGGTPVTVPPLPTQGPAGPAASQLPAGVSSEAARAIRLTISAARADGTLTVQEEAAILEQARAVGAEEFVRREIAQPAPLASVLAGARPESRDDLYRLAFAIVRADESVTGAERIYLAQVAHHLGLTPEAVAQLEREAAGAIEQSPAV